MNSEEVCNYQVYGILIGLVIAVIASFVMFRLGIQHRKNTAEKEIGSAEEESKRILNEAQR